MALLVVVCAVAVLTQSSAAKSVPDLEISLHARSMVPGEVVAVDVRVPADATEVSVSGMGQDTRAWSLGDGRWRALLGIDLDVTPGPQGVTATARDAGGRLLTAQASFNVETKEFPTRTLTVDPKFVTPPPGVRPRIEREAAELARLFGTATAPGRWPGVFEAPIAGALVSGFGVRSVFNGQARAPHGGADFASPAGTPIAAPNAGIVVLASNLYFTGNTVVLDHGGGLLSLFAHLSRVDVRDGESVVKGAVVGAVGATGRVTGPHLHWTVRLHGTRVDPMSLVFASTIAVP
jgi:murein DD-endopeptidase MepM/ murein hydrolase activator NlpD